MLLCSHITSISPSVMILGNYLVNEVELYAIRWGLTVHNELMKEVCFPNDVNSVEGLNMAYSKGHKNNHHDRNARWLCVYITVDCSRWPAGLKLAGEIHITDSTATIPALLLQQISWWGCFTLWNFNILISKNPEKLLNPI